MRLRLPAERPMEPPTGYKIAHPVLSHDGTRVRLTGGSLGGALPYGVVADADAVCVQRPRPPAPARLCDCGFHCVHERAAAEALLGTTEHRSAVLLEVSALGRLHPLPARFPLCPPAGAHGGGRPVRVRGARLRPGRRGLGQARLGPAGARRRPSVRAACVAVRP